MRPGELRSDGEAMTSIRLILWMGCFAWTFVAGLVTLYAVTRPGGSVREAQIVPLMAYSVLSFYVLCRSIDRVMDSCPRDRSG